MKRIFLILLVLITTATSAYTAIITDEAEEDVLSSNAGKEYLPKEVVEESLSINVEENSLHKEAIEEPLSSNAGEMSMPEEAIADTLSYKIAQINSIADDEQKIKEWTRLNSEENYVIINKKDCSATVYDKDGAKINTFEVGIGKDIGDDFNDTNGLAGKAKNTTPAGEYTLIRNIIDESEYGDFTLSLGKKANKPQSAKKVVALHKVPKFRQKDRLDKFYDGNLANNRMSHGCINFLEDDFKELTEYIHGGFKVYVLPEESDNQLILAKNDKDELELTQTKY